MKDDLADKSREVKAAQVTQERLASELQLRQVELEKIASLDVKIGEEMGALANRMRDMKVRRKNGMGWDGMGWERGRDVG